MKVNLIHLPQNVSVEQKEIQSLSYRITFDISFDLCFFFYCNVRNIDYERNH